ncbi:MAG TPA: cytochrome c [Ignavibacteria bacterium]|nr:cytochrome c [Ignavibacteria bacterium]
MKIKLISLSLLFVSCLFIFSNCSENKKQNFGGYESQVKWGEHLVTVGGCNDCHTPKKMTPQGPIPDNSIMLSGHPAGMPAPDVDRKEIESKGLIVTQTLTAWVGPWGVSYAANLTPDATGIGNWQESNFLIALRQGKYKGIPAARPLMPPMPWEMYKEMTDDEIKAVFAYLKSLKPVNNLVPDYQPPVPVSK